MQCAMASLGLAQEPSLGRQSRRPRAPHAEVFFGLLLSGMLAVTALSHHVSGETPFDGRNLGQELTEVQGPWVFLSGRPGQFLESDSLDFWREEESMCCSAQLALQGKRGKLNWCFHTENCHCPGSDETKRKGHAIPMPTQAPWKGS